MFSGTGWCYFVGHTHFLMMFLFGQFAVSSQLKSIQRTRQLQHWRWWLIISLVVKLPITNHLAIILCYYPLKKCIWKELHHCHLASIEKYLEHKFIGGTCTFCRTRTHTHTAARGRVRYTYYIRQILISTLGSGFRYVLPSLSNGSQAASKQGLFLTKCLHQYRILFQLVVLVCFNVLWRGRTAMLNITSLKQKIKSNNILVDKWVQWCYFTACISYFQSICI